MIVSLVEDDSTVLTLLAELLRTHGHDPRPILITHDDTVAAALDRLAQEGAPVILLDLGMPVPGLEILAAAKADPRFANNRYIVATAGLDGPRRVPRAADVRSIAKPYDLPELLAAIAG